jgi:hypothetical protein
MSDVVNKIYKITKLINSISDDEMKELKDIVDSQLNYIHPFKHQQAKKQNDLGNHNKMVYYLISKLRECFSKEVQDGK